jgi:hypothetical protein
MLLSGIFLCGGDGWWPQETAPGDRGLEEDYFGGRTRHVQGGQSAPRVRGGVSKRFFAETAGSVHVGSHKQPQNRTDSHRRTRTSTKPNSARDAAAGSRATAIGARRGASLALPAAGMYTRDFYHIRALSVSTSQNWNSSAQAVCHGRKAISRRPDRRN